MKQARHLSGTETRGTTCAFGDFGLMATESAWITNRQIEAARIAINRHLKRGGKVWIRVYPDKPLTKKPAEVRMGKGKGSPELWVAEVKRGRVLYEINGVAEEIALRALQLGAAKLPVKTRTIKRSIH
jgi:large subunit ribosomal protein L16